MQAQNVNEARESFKAANVAIMGISPDTPEKQKKFQQKYALVFPLLSDTEHKVAKDYGVWGEKTMFGKKSFGIIRSSFLIDEEGKILKAWYKISPKNTVPEVMKCLGD